MNKLQRAIWRERFENLKPSPVLGVMLALICTVVATSLYLSTDEPKTTESFIGTLEGNRTEAGPDGRRFFIVRLATGDRISVEVERSLPYREGAEVRLSRGVAAGGRIDIGFIGYLSPG